MLFKIFPWTRGLQTVRDYNPWGMKCTKQILEKQKLEKTSHYLFPSSSSPPITFSKPYPQGSLSLAFLKLWAKEQPQSLGTQQAGPEEAVLGPDGRSCSPISIPPKQRYPQGYPLIHQVLPGEEDVLTPAQLYGKICPAALGSSPLMPLLKAVPTIHLLELY